MVVHIVCFNLYIKNIRSICLKQSKIYLYNIRMVLKNTQNNFNLIFSCHKYFLYLYSNNKNNKQNERKSF